jgi:transposase InsO family protein
MRSSQNLDVRSCDGTAGWVDEGVDGATAGDNVVAETFFATLKKELVHRRSWPTRRELTGELFEYVEGFYITTRRRSTLGYLSPAQFETVTMTNKIND